MYERRCAFIQGLRDLSSAVNEVINSDETLQSFKRAAEMPVPDGDISSASESPDNAQVPQAPRQVGLQQVQQESQT